MLEILFLYFLCKNIGQKLRDKGRTALPFQILLVLMWFGGEIAGGIIAMIVYVVVQNQPPPEFSLPLYLGAIAGAACGAGFCYFIVWLLPSEYEEPVPVEFPNAGSTGAGFPPANPNNPYSSPQTWND